MNSLPSTSVRARALGTVPKRCGGTAASRKLLFTAPGMTLAASASSISERCRLRTLRPSATRHPPIKRLLSDADPLLRHASTVSRTFDLDQRSPLGCGPPTVPQHHNV